MNWQLESVADQVMKKGNESRAMNNTKVKAAEHYRGVVVPMVTPITPQGNLDEAAARRIIDHMIAGGVDGVFVLGTTGEANSVPRTMRLRLVTLAVEQAQERVRVYAGISDNCLAHSIEAAFEYSRLGIDALVAHLPSYYALGAQEMLAYYRKLADSIPAPLLVYNIPQTTHMSLPVEVIEQLSSHPNIVGLKDSENDPLRLEGVMSRLGGRSDFSILIGAAALTAKGLALGADGSVPSGGNLVPEIWSALYKAAKEGNHSKATEYQQQADQFSAIYQRSRFARRSIPALKAAMGALGLCGPDVLPPLLPLTEAEQADVRDEFHMLKVGVY